MLLLFFSGMKKTCSSVRTISLNIDAGTKHECCNTRPMLFASRTTVIEDAAQVRAVKTFSCSYFLDFPEHMSCLECCKVSSVPGHPPLQKTPPFVNLSRNSLSTGIDCSRGEHRKRSVNSRSPKRRHAVKQLQNKCFFFFLLPSKSVFFKV